MRDTITHLEILQRSEGVWIVDNDIKQLIGPFVQPL
jgi:hypothetical protein